MIFKCEMEGLELSVPDPRRDTRGEVRNEYKDFNATHVLTTFNTSSGTFRGFHYQIGSFAQRKLVRCIRGAIQDVVIDIRKESATYLKSFSTILSADNCNSLIVPKGFAHGYLTLAPATEVLYLIDGEYNKDAERGIRFKDMVTWTAGVHLIEEPVFYNDRDARWPNFEP
jgi:dTDP-4-dehydrorhamnose 3,5-epimerase